MDSNSEENKHINVLLVTLAAQGHINPLLRLGNRLASKSLYVTLAINDYALKHRSAVASSVGNVRIELFSDGLPSDYNRKVDMDCYMNTLGKFGPINLSALIRSHTRKFACIIYTPFIPWVADVAAELGIPSALLWIQPCALYQIYCRYYNQLNEFPSETDPNVSVKLPGLPVLCTEELPSFILPSNTLRCFDSVLNQLFHNMHKVKWVLGNSFMELEKDVITSLNDAGYPFLPVGPMVPAALFGKEEEFSGGLELYKSDGQSNCLEWLDKQQPSSVVYISFGTILYLSRREMESITIALKNTKRPFLWVIKPQQNQEPEELGFLEDVKDQGLIVKWSPQTAVLSHPSVGCFLCHCGWNSLLESLTAGVPVIACPKWTDQPTNAKLATDVWSVGVKLKRNSEDGVNGDEVERCVEEIMRGPSSEEFRKNAAELKEAARAAVAGGGSSDKNIQMFVNEIISMCS